MSKKNVCATLASYLLCFFTLSAYAQKKIVILGSSTAAGSGASSYANSWVGKYAAYVASLGAGHSVTNLALGGYNTYMIVPTGTPHQGRPECDPARNITAAVAVYHANVVIVNMPSNDVANSYDVSETLLNYRRIKAYTDSAGVALYVATTQPRNFTDAGKLGQQMQIRDSTIAQYGNFAIDVWNTLANPDGTMVAAYNSGDGVHLNDDGHEVLFQRVKAKPILGVTLLPLVLKNFSGQILAGGVRLQWEVIGSEKFEQAVERSEDGRHFIDIGRPLNFGGDLYSFTDNNVAVSAVYYRVKLATPGFVRYSDVVRLAPNRNTTGVEIFPNPVAGRLLRLQVCVDRDARRLFTITNAGGKVVYRKELGLNRGTSSVGVPLPPAVQAGVYFLQVAGSDGVSGNRIFVLQ